MNILSKFVTMGAATLAVAKIMEIKEEKRYSGIDSEPDVQPLIRMREKHYDQYILLDFAISFPMPITGEVGV